MVFAEFVDSVEAMNRLLGIPRQLDALREADLAGLAAAACREADTRYPVAQAMSHEECEALLREVLPGRCGRPGRRNRRRRRRLR